MAQKVNIVLVDDIDGSDAVETVAFGLDGRDYEIYLGHARRAGGRKRGRTDVGPSPADIRAWARANGFDVPERGRVSSTVREAYVAAH
jgi:hypothetical protein